MSRLARTQRVAPLHFDAVVAPVGKQRHRQEAPAAVVRLVLRRWRLSPRRRCRVGCDRRRVLRRALAGLVPDEIVARPKQGFDLPLAAWLRGPLRELAAAHLDERALARWPGLNAKEAAGLVAAHLSGAQDFGLPIFNLLSISLFLERHGL